MFHYTVSTEQTIEKAINSLEKSLKEKKFGVLWTLDIQETLLGKGIDFDQPYFVLEVCNPQEAKNILSQNKMAGYFLPCKIVVYEDEGKTKIGLLKLAKLMEPLEDEKITQIVSKVEKQLIQCIDNSI